MTTLLLLCAGLLCFTLYIGFDAGVSLIQQISPPTIPDYPNSQRVGRRVERGRDQNITLTQFQTTDPPADVAAYFERALGPRDGKWLSSASMGFYPYNPSSHRSWTYDPDYCPFTKVILTFAEQPDGLTLATLRIEQTSCRGDIPFL